MMRFLILIEILILEQFQGDFNEKNKRFVVKDPLIENTEIHISH